MSPEEQRRGMARWSRRWLTTREGLLNPRLIERIWPLWAHAAQLPPEGDWSVWVVMGGRGAGKTRAGAEWVRGLVESGQARSIALVGPSLQAVREVMIEGVSGLKAVANEGMRPEYNVSRRRLEWPNGAVAHVFSAEDPDSLRGPQFDAAWCDEIGAWANDVATWDTLMFGLRAGAAPRVVATTTPRASELVRRLVGLASEFPPPASLPPPARGRGDACERSGGRDQVGVELLRGQRVSSCTDVAEGDPPVVPPFRGDDPHVALAVNRNRVVLTRIATRENAANLAPGWVEAMEEAYRGSHLLPQELEGVLVDDLPGAMFSRALIGKWRVTMEEAAGLERVVVAVDPPAGAGNGAACGIVCAGIRGGVVFVLEDASVRGLRPMEWARRVADVARRRGAGGIVAEANQGGEMVREMLRMAGAEATTRVTLRNATQSKRDRAEPVSGKYEQGLVRHAGVFRELEDEMCSFGAAEGAASPARSPDRVDALVWAVRELTAPGVIPRVESLWE